MQNAQRSLTTMGAKMQKVGTNLSVGVTAPLVAFAGLALKTASDLETLETSLSVMTGSAESGAKALADLSEFTASTPFQLQDVGTSAKQLLAFGFSVDEVKEKLQTIGDISAGSGNGLGDIAQIFGQISAAGKLTGERFNQLQERAVPIGSAIAETMGIAESAVKDFISSGKVSFEDFETAFNSLAQDDGLFANAMKKQSETIAGLFSTLKDNVQLALGEIGISIAQSINLKEVIAGVTSAIREAVTWFGTLSDSTKKFIVIFAGIAAAVGPLLALAGTILPAIGTGLALLTGPIGLVVAGLTAVGIVIYKNWEPIKATLVEIANYFIDLYNESTIFRLAVEAISGTFKNMFDVAKFVFEAIYDYVALIGSQIKTVFTNLGDIVKAVLTGNVTALPALMAKALGETIGNIKDFSKEATENFKTLQSSISDNVNAGIDNAFSAKKHKLLADNVDTSEVTEKVENAVASGLTNGLNSAGTGEVDLTPLLSKVKLNIEPLGASVGSGAFITEILDSIPVEEMDEKLIAFKSSLLDFQEETSSILETTAEDFAVGFGEILAGIALGTSGIGDIGALLINTIGTIAKQLGEAAIKMGITIGALKLTFSNPLGAIAAGIGLVALGTLLQSASANFAGNFATGGIVGGNSYTGDNLTAGVNSGELILNIAQQKNLATALSSNGSSVTLQPSIDFSMNKFRVGLQRVETSRNRNT